MYKNMYFNEVNGRFMNLETVYNGENVEIFEEAIKNFKSEGFDTVTAYKSHFGLKNEMSAWENETWNSYVHSHFFAFEHFLVDTCKALSVFVSFKPHKARLSEITDELTGNYVEWRKEMDLTYYDSSFGIGEDVINCSPYGVLVESGHLTRKQAEYLETRPLDVAVWLNNYYWKVAKELLEIIELNDFECVFSEANCFGFKNCLE